MTDTIIHPAKTLVPDPFMEGIAAGWNAYEAHSREMPKSMQADVVIIGTGAGGGITAEMCAKAGLKVLLIEEGPLKTSKDFKMLESVAYPTLYQEGAARKTADKAINILQGRAVGGSTTVNWTSSFRTPADTLSYWQNEFGLSDMTEEAMAPWFEQAERRLNIEDWVVPPNENNDILRRGAVALGLSWGAIRRNVRECWNLGYCGMGCPTNAKQSMLVSTIPTALAAGAELVAGLRAHSFVFKQGRIINLRAQVMNPDGILPSGKQVNIVAKHYVLAGGSINTPAVLLRSNAPDPHGLLGERTFLHPVVISAATMEQEVRADAGAPQTIYSDHYLHTDPIDGPIGFKLEAPPLHPVIFSSTLPGFAQRHAEVMRNFSKTHMQLALLRDGFRPDSAGGQVRLQSDDTPVLDYKLTPAIWDAARRALVAMAELQHAAGAKTTLPIHEFAQPASNIDEALKQINSLEMKPLIMKVVSAHVMGGARMAGDERRGVVGPDGRHWQIENLSVHDGSLFPTSIGANPQLSIYGLVNKLSHGLVSQLTGQTPASLA
ncbi:GMC family oxidoreductase N-terminal domain-containing protein [Limnobacter sp.]|uniref:GMC family oxidoreductase N-terminal domain-containing protein n=1 Tax=Limnobacter sp. TaxID=2003368 RepID=UPI003510EE98